ncbi:MAG: globin domain-containing protein, partial [Prosthecobacter sp.]
RVVLLKELDDRGFVFYTNYDSRKGRELAAHPVAALVFYRRLFEISPELRPMFKGDIEMQSKKLIEMLGVLIAMLERPHGLELELKEMGARHAEYGVKAAHYTIVGGALLDMLAETLDKGFTPEVREAWTLLYGAVEATMKAGAEGMPKPE